MVSVYKYSKVEGLVSVDLPIERVLTSNAFLYGESLFSSIYVENSKPWFLDNHIERLLNSLSHFDILNTQQVEESLDEVLKTLRFKEHEYLRLTFFKSGDDIYFYPSHREILNPRLKKKQISLCTQNCHRFYGPSMKWGNYLQQRLDLAQLNKDQDVLYIGEEGEILECSTSNIFFFDGSQIYTPVLKKGLLAGVYRRNLVSKFKKIVLEKTIYLDEIERFQYAWMTNCLKGIRTISKINQVKFEKNLAPILEGVFY